MDMTRSQQNGMVHLGVRPMLGDGGQLSFAKKLEESPALKWALFQVSLIVSGINSWIHKNEIIDYLNYWSELLI